MKVPVYNSKGTVVAEQELNEKVFAVKGKPELVQQAVVAEQANARQPLAHTKTRGEVRGGGKKPWQQKGTGRARQGSIRSPQWRGGGVVFGPRNTRSYAVAINKKMKRKALLTTLSDKVATQRFVVLENLDLTGKAKDWQTATKAVWATLKPTRKNPTVLVVMPTLADGVKRSTKNVKGVEAVRADSLNVGAVLKHDYAITTVEGIKALESWFTKNK